MTSQKGAYRGNYVARREDREYGAMTAGSEAAERKLNAAENDDSRFLPQPAVDQSQFRNSKPCRSWRNK